MNRRTTIALTAVLGAVVVLGSAGLARTEGPKIKEVMPKLAADYTYPQGKDSPGKVTFSHESHVDLKKPDCTTCHPKLFKILERGQTADGAPINHKKMEAGLQCGTCHNGKAAFAMKDCETCHSGK
ncbi:MAG TPA: c(7)-type cytochrome triheme domain-containing protein [Polyangia bacterium]|jgi:c(7)-type cytochrome triheme protein